MSHYLVQFKYSQEAVHALIDHPAVDHQAQAAAMLDSLGAKLHGYWYCFGEFDGVVLLEAPDSRTAAAITIAIGGTGEVTRLETTVLLTMQEAREAARIASAAQHLPPHPGGGHE